MKIVTITAGNAAEALDKIHEQLGPEAVVLNVRPLPSRGLSRLWKPGQGVEVLAGVPEDSVSGTEPGQDNEAAPMQSSQAPARARSFAVPPLAVAEAATKADGTDWSFAGTPPLSMGMRASVSQLPGGTGFTDNGKGKSWSSLIALQADGLLPVFARLLEGRMAAECPDGVPPASIQAQWGLVRDALQGFWREPKPLDHNDQGLHVFIGPPGVGKTTLLCKWLAKSVLLEQRTARVWRLDGFSANTAEILSVYGEMLGAPVERFWPGTSALGELSLVDLPGVANEDTLAMEALKEQLAQLPSPHIHLVLNAAYDTPLLFEQFRLFSAFKPEDVSFTHLDEEKRRSKLLNFVLGTNCSLQFLGTGQKIPSELLQARVEHLLPGKNSPEIRSFAQHSQ